jgi:hypothetical protein
VLPLSHHLVNHMRTRVCVILFLSHTYQILGLRVSPRSQQQLHNCGATIERGIYERSVAIPLSIEGEGGTHHSSKKRRRGKRREVSEVRE